MLSFHPCLGHSSGTLCIVKMIQKLSTLALGCPSVPPHGIIRASSSPWSRWGPENFIFCRITAVCLDIPHSHWGLVQARIMKLSPLCLSTQQSQTRCLSVCLFLSLPPLPSLLPSLSLTHSLPASVPSPGYFFLFRQKASLYLGFP